MFCSKCGKEIKDDANFCRECGQPTSLEITKNINEHKTKSYNITAYADTSFKFALFGTLFWCCCGMQLLAGLPAILFGVLAVKNHEAEQAKAYIGLVLGIIDIIIFAVLIAMGE